MKKFLISTRCKRRSIDSQKIYNYLLKNGWASTNSISSANLIIVSTCAVTKEKEKSSFNIIKKLLEKKSDSARIIVTGCLPGINPEKIKPLEGILTISPRNLDKLDSIIGSNIKFSEIPDPNIILNIEKKLRIINDRKKGNKNGLAETYNIRIAKGCLGSCSYCAIKFVMGELESKPLNKIVEEFKRGLSLGFSKFMLISEDTGSYGIDIGLTICDLLEKIFSLNGKYKLIIDDFNAQWLIKYFNKLFSLFLKNYEQIEDILIPLQSGSNRILKLMGRPYDIETVKMHLKILRKNIPYLKIQTHIMVGFPDERVKDFNESKKLLREFNFSRVAVYKYSDRPNVKSFCMKNKNSQKTINERTNEIVQLSPHYFLY